MALVYALLVSTPSGRCNSGNQVMDADHSVSTEILISSLTGGCDVIFAHHKNLLSY